MDKFIGKITEVINNNSELKNSAILGRVIENIQYKSSGVDNLTLLTLIKECNGSRTTEKKITNIFRARIKVLMIAFYYLLLVKKN